MRTYCYQLKTLAGMRRFLRCLVLLLVRATAGLLTAQTAVDEEAPWPRTRSANGNSITLYAPQVERWTSNSFSARAAVEVKLAEPKEELVGVVWFDAHGSVNHSNRVVTLDKFEITKGRFPDAKDNGSNALAVVREMIPSGARTVSLDYLVTTLGFEKVAARQGERGLKHEPPEIIWVTNPAVLVRIDGTPVLHPISGSALKRVVNTPALLISDAANSAFYLSGQDKWFTAASLDGPWSLAQTPPAEVSALSPAAGQGNSDQPIPTVFVRTVPAELLITAGMPDFRSIRGTALQYAADSDSQLFFHTGAREAYLLLSGRWFKAPSLRGPWTYVAPHDLPQDFARIPPNSPQGIVLASVPDTSSAEVALLANSVPDTATVKRAEARLQVSYDGDPQFKPIEGTSLSYAINAETPVIRADNKFYAVDNGVWFVASSANGPWKVATEVPDEIYTIPPSSPMYYVTFARIYDATDDEVEVGYTPGYVGAYEDEGTVVYGTGWDYAPWTGTEYYGWGWTWGYGYTYVPWYQYWVWRPWWSPPGGLRAALIENIYDRWQGGAVVTPYGVAAASSGRAPSAERAPSADRAQSAQSAQSADRAQSAQSAQSAERAASAERAPSAGRASSASSAGYPALYGRFKGSSRPEAMSPPANTVALNPYARPQSSAKSGEVPRGAQLLTSIQRSPGGGRDLYASPDGNVYLRKSDGWFRREAAGGWSYYAPTQARVERDRSTSAARIQPTGAAVAYRPLPGAVSSMAGSRAGVGRLPDTGNRVRAQEVSSLERQYYARALAQIRTQNWRASRGRTGAVRARR